MPLNILIVIVVGLLSYGLTVYFNHNDAPNIIVQDEGAATQSVEAAQSAPDFAFIDVAGKEHKLSDFEGKIVMLNFWASWCTPCVKEFPDLLELAANYAEDVVLIALSSDHDEAAMNRFLEKLRKDGAAIERDNVLVALDTYNRITQEIYQTYRLPETLIIDRTGKLRHKLVGADWQPEDVHKILSAL